MQVGFWKHKIRGSAQWLWMLLGLLIVGAGAIALSRYQIDIVLTPMHEPTSALTSEPDLALPLPLDATSAVVTPTPGSPLWNPDVTGDRSRATGSLRVSNQTQHPIRIVILEQAQIQRNTNTAEAPTPAHWDFAPAEGSTQGIILSLPVGNLTLKPDDIVMAYAQDGSSRYWGPYVVSQTDQPRWNPRMQEWQFMLRP